MSDWKDRTKQNLKQVYQVEGAPLQAWQWALVAAGLYLLFRSVKPAADFLDIWTASSNTKMDVFIEEERKRIARKEQLTYPTLQYNVYADALQQEFAVGPGGLFESGDAILDVFESAVMTDRDLIRLIIAFGSRKIEWQMDNLTLLQAISRLTTEIIPDLNKMFKEKGMTIRI